MIARVRQSLFSRMVIAQIAILAVTAGGLTFAQSYLLHLTLDDFVGDRLHKDAASVIHPELRHHPLAAGTLYEAQHGSRSFAVVDGLGQIVLQGPRPLPFPVAAFPRGGRETVMHNGAIDAVILPDNHNGKPVWVIVSQDRRRPQVMVDDVVVIFLRRFLWVIPAGLLLSLLSNIAITASAMRSVTRVAKQVELIDSQNLEARVDAQALPLEVRSLASATNHALDRLARGFAIQGQFVADVAHELRTPLALINLRAEAIEDSVVRGKVIEAVGRASHVVSQLMDLARAENATQAIGPVDPGELAAEAVATHAPLVFRGGREIAYVPCASPVPRIMASARLVEIVLANLIENAGRHTPVGSTIILSVDETGAILVSDDGPGILKDDHDPEHPRYRRGDKARTDGAGLGLKIVERIMTAHGGAMIIAKCARVKEVETKNNMTVIRLTFRRAEICYS